MPIMGGAFMAIIDMGRGTLLERPELRQFQVTQEAEAWERGEPVPMREAERWQVSELSDYEIDTVYVDQSEGQQEVA